MSLRHPRGVPGSEGGVGNGANAGSQAGRALSRDLSDFLIEFSIALNKHAMYPEGHPSLEPAVTRVVERLTPLLDKREALSLGVARHQLVIEGVATDPKNPVLSDLAARLHRHHLGAITFRRAIRPDELDAAFAMLAVEADRMPEPLGLGPRERLSQWSGVRLFPVTYERLHMVGEGAPPPEETTEQATTRTRAAQLWLGLARAAMAADAAAAGVEHAEPEASRDEERAVADPRTVADAIGTHPRNAAYDQVIVGYLLQMAEELRAGGAPESAELKRRMSQLITHLDEATLRALLEMGGDGGQRRQFLLNAAEGIAVNAVLDLVQAASETEQHSISHSLLRVLQKLAQHAERGSETRRAVADSALREQVMELIRGWSLADPNPGAYGQALARMTRAQTVFAVAPEERFRPESRRLLEMALEVDEAGEGVIRATEQVCERGDHRWLVERLGEGTAPKVATAVWQYLSSPAHFARFLRSEPIEVETLDAILAHAGSEVIEPMLDVLAESDASQTRRLLLDRLLARGPKVGHAAAERLADPRWYVVRNMLKLLADLPDRPANLDIDACTKHEDPRVRLEAARLALATPERRDRTLCALLTDRDERLVRFGLHEAMHACPAPARPLVVARATTEGPTELRALAVRALARVPDPLALDALLGLARPRRGMLGTRLPPKTPLYLAALRALREGFAEDSHAARALAAARQARDPEIAEAAGATAAPA